MRKQGKHTVVAEALWRSTDFCEMSDGTAPIRYDQDILEICLPSSGNRFLPVPSIRLPQPTVPATHVSGGLPTCNKLSWTTTCSIAWGQGRRFPIPAVSRESQSDVSNPVTLFQGSSDSGSGTRYNGVMDGAADCVPLCRVEKMMGGGGDGDGEFRTLTTGF